MMKFKAIQEPSEPLVLHTTPTIKGPLVSPSFPGFETPTVCLRLLFWWNGKGKLNAFYTIFRKKMS